MKIFGLSITRQPPAPAAKGLQSVEGRGGWSPIIEEPFPGAWQTNTTSSQTDSLAYWAVMRCITMISSDIAKMDLELTQKDENGISEESESPAFSPVLRKPNRYQNRIQFIQNWLESKLARGNAYILLARDNRNLVVEMFVLDPFRVRPLVSDTDGSVFYELRKDILSDVMADRLVVPASEIIHDRWNTFYHPLVGLSPLYAAGLTALMGKRIQTNSSEFFANGSTPAGVLSAPGLISDDTAKRLKEHWEANYSGSANVGKIAVLGDGLKFEPMRMTATDAQLIEQLKWTDAMIAGAFGVPAYMINAGTAPAYNNVEALNQQYYSQCLQILIEAIELCLDEGLSLPRGMKTEFDLDDLLRMDTATQIAAIKDAVSAGVMAPDEGRAKLGFRPTAGGDSPYLQQQNYSLAALAKRDQQTDPFAPKLPPPQAPAQPDQLQQNAIDGEQAAFALLELHKGFAHASI